MQTTAVKKSLHGFRRSPEEQYAKSRVGDGARAGVGGEGRRHGLRVLGEESKSWGQILLADSQAASAGASGYLDLSFTPLSRLVDMWEHLGSDGRGQRFKVILGYILSLRLS